eukprot:3250166-Amphidinium_carterae.1
MFFIIIELQASQTKIAGKTIQSDWGIDSIDIGRIRGFVCIVNRPLQTKITSQTLLGLLCINDDVGVKSVLKMLRRGEGEIHQCKFQLSISSLAVHLTWQRQFRPTPSATDMYLQCENTTTLHANSKTSAFKFCSSEHELAKIDTIAWLKFGGSSKFLSLKD